MIILTICDCTAQIILVWAGNTKLVRQSFLNVEYKCPILATDDWLCVKYCAFGAHNQMFSITVQLLEETTNHWIFALAELLILQPQNSAEFYLPSFT